MTEKILELPEADQWVARQKAGGLKFGFTCGAFDILHAGHVSLLERARSLCDRLLVAVNSDYSVQNYKTPLRPINPQQDRMRIVAALACVDAVVLMEDLRPIGLIERWHPDLYIKGGDYQTSGLRSGPVVEAYGGKVVLLPFEVDSSTTSIIERIARAELYQAAGAAIAPAKLIFVDRDGTMIEDVPYLSDPKRVRLLPGVGPGLATLHKAGFRLVMATNQQGIGLGYYGLDEFYAVNLEIFRQLGPFGVQISRVAFCPHSLADHCRCRKPLPGMLLSAMKYYRTNPSECYMLGDTAADVEAGEAAGCFPIRIGKEVASFADSVQLILDREGVS
jgi:rfaE bifunctional protein nucleotidyltransferase chain/domain